MRQPTPALLEWDMNAAEMAVSRRRLRVRHVLTSDRSKLLGTKYTKKYTNILTGPRTSDKSSVSLYNIPGFWRFHAAMFAVLWDGCSAGVRPRLSFRSVYFID